MCEREKETEAERQQYRQREITFFVNEKRGREAEADVWFVQGKERHTGRERDTDELKNGKERNRENKKKYKEANNKSGGETDEGELKIETRG